MEITVEIPKEAIESSLANELVESNRSLSTQKFNIKMENSELKRTLKNIAGYMDTIEDYIGRINAEINRSTR